VHAQFTVNFLDRSLLHDSLLAVDFQNPRLTVVYVLGFSKKMKMMGVSH